MYIQYVWHWGSPCSTTSRVCLSNIPTSYSWCTCTCMSHGDLHWWSFWGPPPAHSQCGLLSRWPAQWRILNTVQIFFSLAVVPFSGHPWEGPTVINKIKTSHPCLKMNSIYTALNKGHLCYKMTKTEIILSVIKGFLYLQELRLLLTPPTPSTLTSCLLICSLLNFSPTSGPITSTQLLGRCCFPTFDLLELRLRTRFFSFSLGVPAILYLWAGEGFSLEKLNDLCVCVWGGG